MKEEPTAMYIKLSGRGWAVWTTPNDELMAIPEDEEPYDKDDLLVLEQYLFNEGFFKEHYSRRLAKLEEM
jgi:hypothetical protein